MHDDYDDDDRALINERYGWKEGEREAVEAEQAERRAQIKRDEVMAWCRQRAAKGICNVDTPGPTDELGRPLNDPRYRLEPEVVTRSHAAQTNRTHASEKKRDMALLKAIAQVVVAEEKQREKIDGEILAKLDTLTTQIEELRERLEASPASRTLKIAG